MWSARPDAWRLDLEPRVRTPDRIRTAPTTALKPSTAVAVDPGASVEAGCGPHVCVRRIPYPYRALLAICSDLDETPDKHVYLESMRFLNTTAQTSMGPGLGLEVGNSIYFDMPPDQFAYWNTDDAGRAMVRELIRSRHIDCLHSFGDLATTRAHAARALDELVRHDCRLEVWVDHGVAPSNFGADIMRGLGDVAGARVFHADLTCAFGVQFVWRGRVTSVIGQDVRPTLEGIFTLRHPVASLRTMVKEFLKGALARRGNEKYAMHASNRLLRPIRLRNDERAWEFIRSNPFWGGVDRGETADGLAGVLTERLLTRLVDREAVCVLYTHLGKIRGRAAPFLPPTRRALARLADYVRSAKLLVTTTRRLLGYCRALQAVSVCVSAGEDGHALDLGVGGPGTADGLRPSDLDGLTIYVPDPARTLVTVNGAPVKGLRRNPPDHTGRPSVSLPWRPLEFPLA
jgi:hypothetical protein